jgi:hypothetical protein
MNTANANCASIGGGVYNWATGQWATVSGGDSVTEATDDGWSAGGSFHNP